MIPTTSVICTNIILLQLITASLHNFRTELAADRPEDDMSHVVHVDNCILHSPTQCYKRPPAYTFRDYSAIIYLNQDFQVIIDFFLPF